MLNRNFVFSLSVLLGIFFESPCILSAEYEAPSDVLDGIPIQTVFFQSDDLRKKLKAIGKEYLDQSMSQSELINNRESTMQLFSRHFPVMPNVSNSSIRAMIASYENETNPGTICAHRCLGTPYLTDDARMAGYIFVALAQLLK